MSGGPVRDAKGFASLSSGLLARKGAARPAMRPYGHDADESDDLGWNDLGAAPPEAPEVHRQQDAIAREFAATPAPAASGRRTAFTLRLDAERHLRLRLVCAVERRSAQQIVTQALDTLLATRTEAGRIAESLPPAARLRRAD